MQSTLALHSVLAQHLSSQLYYMLLFLLFTVKVQLYFTMEGSPKLHLISICLGMQSYSICVLNPLQSDDSKAC